MPQTKPMSWISMITLLILTTMMLKTLTQATEFNTTIPNKKLSLTKKMKW